ncbi:MAG: class I SAM-dependent methyltransferase [Nitrospirae bacterium]|nr:class I SAM-dependent methyltransferase [Nitrospirota bacterium]
MTAPAMTHGMIEAQAPPQTIRRVYNFWSLFYGTLAAPLERKPRLRGLDLAAVKPREKILEVAVGPGATFLEILKRVDQSTVVSGVDLSPRMLDTTRRAATRAGYDNVDLQLADARRLPFADGSFDVLYNSYMLDLIPLDELGGILSEFKRVLRPGGRMVLVNMSKSSGEDRTFWERLYLAAPKSWVPYLFGGCRPVLMEGPLKHTGFREVKREFIAGPLPSEIVGARKPAS